MVADMDYSFEIGRLDEDIRNSTAAVDRFLSMAGLLGAAALTIGFAKKDAQPLVLIVVPYAMAVVVIFILQIYTDNERKFVMRQHLELMKWSSSLGVPMFQPYVLDGKYRNRGSVRAVGVIWGLLFLALLAASIVAAHRVLSWGLEVVHYGGLAFVVTTITIAYLELASAEKRALLAIASVIDARTL